MASSPVSNTIQTIVNDLGPFMQFWKGSRYSQRAGQPGICDFVVGNPHEPQVPGFAETLQAWASPQSIDWFAYKMSEPNATEVVAASLRSKLGIPFEPDHVMMTNGAFAGLNAAIRVVCNPGDEVIFLSPPWFFYEAIIKGSGATPISVPVRRDNWDLDLDAIRDAITPATRAIIVNSPNNPTGKIYSPETLRTLSDLLTEASNRAGRTIYLVSDEAYSHILVEGAEFRSPVEFYPASFLIYTYGKTLLTPGQRLGYIAISPEMPEPETMMVGLLATLVTSGYGFPNAVLQHAIGDLDKLSIDIEHLNVKRNRMMTALRAMGYEIAEPEGTFYLLVKAPLEDDAEFVDMLADHDVFVGPGWLFEVPGYFRISLTANMDMIERALPVFEIVMKQIREPALAGVGVD